MHTVMPHGKTIAYGNCIKLHWGSACSKNAIFDRTGDLLQVHVSGNNFVETVDHAHQRSCHLFTGISQRTQ